MQIDPRKALARAQLLKGKAEEELAKAERRLNEAHDNSEDLKVWEKELEKSIAARTINGRELTETANRLLEQAALEAKNLGIDLRNLNLKGPRHE